MLPASTQPLLSYYLIILSIVYIGIIIYWFQNTKKKTLRNFLHAILPFIYLGFVGGSFIIAKNWEMLLLNQLDIIVDEYTVRQIILGYTKAITQILIYTSIFLVYLTLQKKKKQ